MQSSLLKQTYLTEVNVGARGDGTETVSDPVSRLENLIKTLTTNPAFYEEGLEKIAHDFANSIKDEKTLQNCVDVMVDQVTVKIILVLNCFLWHCIISLNIATYFYWTVTSVLVRLIHVAMLRTYPNMTMSIEWDIKP